MSCKNLWKKSIPFFLTFLFGILLVNLFVFDEISEKQSIFPVEKTLNSLSENYQKKSKNCVPVKTNLNEQKEFYTLKELSIIKMIDKRVELENQLENNKILTKEEQEQIQKDIENIKKKVDAFLNRPKTQIMGGEGPFVKPIYLIYLEKCFEK